MTRFDALIAGAGPTGMLTALLAKGLGRNVLGAEVRGFQGTRMNMARFSSDTQQIMRAAGAGDGVFPLRDPNAPPQSFVAPIRDVEHSLRTTGQRLDLPIHYDSRFVDIVEEAGGGVRAKLQTPSGLVDVEAPVLIDATGGGGLSGSVHPSLQLRPRGGDGHAIGVHWTNPQRPTGGLNDARAATMGEVPPITAKVEVDGMVGRFSGHHDAERGTFGVIELPARPEHAVQEQLVEQLRRELGLPGAPATRNDFPISNRMADRAWEGSVAVVGDSVTRLHPRTGRGANLGALDAQDAARLIDDLARFEAPSSPSYAKMLREQIFDRFGKAVMRRHRDALQTEQAPKPFGG